jgi:hypothetical protein
MFEHIGKKTPKKKTKIVKGHAMAIRDRTKGSKGKLLNDDGK